MLSVKEKVKSKKGRMILSVAALLLVIVLLTKYFGEASADDKAGQMQLMQVEVEVISPKKVRVWSEFSGNLVAVDNVEVKPRVGGKITEVLFEEGAIVKKGDPLFIIDPRPYKAALESAKANLNAAYSRAKLASVELERSKQLVEKKAISKSRYDTSLNDYKVANANINAAKAELVQAELNYEYAHIKAPVNGRVSRAEITQGNIIEAGPNAPVLTSVVSNYKLYAEFDVDEQTYIQTVRNRNSDKKMPVELQLSSGDEVTYKGEVHSFDNQLDATSGTIRARAIFENTDGAMVPGMYVNVKLGSATEEETMMVSDRAIGTDQSKKFVYVIDSNNAVVYREVKLGRTVGNKRVVLSGIKEGEKVLVNSLLKVRPGMKVKPVDIAKALNEKPSADKVVKSE